MDKYTGRQQQYLAAAPALASFAADAHRPRSGQTPSDLYCNLAVPKKQSCS